MCDYALIECIPTSTESMARKEYAPAYVVEFRHGSRLTEVWRLTSATDVAEAVAWARRQTFGESFVLYAEDISGDLPLMLRVYDGRRQVTSP